MKPPFKHWSLYLSTCLQQPGETVDLTMSCVCGGGGEPFLQQMKAVTAVPPKTDMKNAMERLPLLLEDPAEEEVGFSVYSRSQGSNFAWETHQ
jgi:hypothetical protein